MKKRNREIILSIYMVVGFACLLWLVFFWYNSRSGSSAALRETKEVPPQEAAPSRGKEETSGARDPGMRKKMRGKLAIVIDDAGYHGDNLEGFLSFPGPLAVSVLPGLEGSMYAAQRTVAAGKELLLHLPMEPENGKDPGPGAVFTNMNDREVLGLVTRHIDSLPGAIGVNNHMGSRATGDERIMRLLLGELKKRALFFLDSRTTPRSVGKKTAKDLNLPFLERAVFLDNEKNTLAIRESIQKGKTIAEKRGYAVMIGHVWCTELAEVLLEVYPEILSEGYQFYPLSELLSGEMSDDDTWD